MRLVVILLFATLHLFAREAPGQQDFPYSDNTLQLKNKNSVDCKISKHTKTKTLLNVGSLKSITGFEESGRCLNIVTIGGSITVGAGVDNLESNLAIAWPAQLEILLNKYFPTHSQQLHKVDTGIAIFKT